MPVGIILLEPSVGVKLKGWPEHTSNDCEIKNGVGFTNTSIWKGDP